VSENFTRIKGADFSIFTFNPIFSVNAPTNTRPFSCPFGHFIAIKFGGGRDSKSWRNLREVEYNFDSQWIQVHLH
jgi:hypothetical protein